MYELLRFLARRCASASTRIGKVIGLSRGAGGHLFT
jgi:hypothetical protein